MSLLMTSEGDSRSKSFWRKAKKRVEKKHDPLIFYGLSSFFHSAVLAFASFVIINTTSI